MIKKFISRFIFFLIFTFFSYIFFIILSGEFLDSIPGKNLYYKKANGKLGWRLKELNERNPNFDILIIGSSRAYRHYDPRNFEKEGYSSFVLGSSSQTFNEAEFLLQKKSNRLRPKIAIIDIYPEMFRYDNLEPQMDVISHFDFESNFLPLFDLDFRIESLNTVIFSFYSNYIRHRTFEERDYNNLNYISGGFLEKKSIEYSKRLNLSQNVEYDKTQIISFRNILSFLEKKNVEIILVQSPMQNGLHFKNYEKFEEIIDSIKYKFYDFKGSSLFKDTLHFYDIRHMNQNGVNLFNKVLLDSLDK